MITILNYFEKKTGIDWSKVSDTTKNSLEDIELLMQTAIDVPESLEVEEIKTEIETFLAEVNKHLKKTAVKKKSQPTANTVKAKPVKKVQPAASSKKRTRKKSVKKETIKPIEKIRGNGW